MSDYAKEREEDYARQRGDWPDDARISNIGQNGNTGEHYMSTLKDYVDSIQGDKFKPKSKYHRLLPDENVWIDVYDVLHVYGVENPAIAHAIKKLLCTGTRGYKDFQQDLQEAIDSLERAKDFPPIPF